MIFMLRLQRSKYDIIAFQKFSWWILLRTLLVQKFNLLLRILSIEFVLIKYFPRLSSHLLGRPTGEPGQEPGEDAVLMGGLEGEEVAPQEIVFSLHRLLPNRAETLTQQ